MLLSQIMVVTITLLSSKFLTTPLTPRQSPGGQGPHFEKSRCDTCTNLWKFFSLHMFLCFPFPRLAESNFCLWFGITDITKIKTFDPILQLTEKHHRNVKQTEGLTVVWISSRVIKLQNQNQNSTCLKRSRSWTGAGTTRAQQNSLLFWVWKQRLL